MLTEKEFEVLQRRARGENQAQIAKALKISQAAVSKFESNAHKKILEAEQIIKISKELNIKTKKGIANKVEYGGRK